MEKVEVLDVAAVRCQAVDEVMQHALRDLAAQLVVITEDVLHRLRLQELDVNKEKFRNQVSLQVSHINTDIYSEKTSFDIFFHYKNPQLPSECWKIVFIMSLCPCDIIQPQNSWFKPHRT